MAQWLRRASGLLAIAEQYLRSQSDRGRGGAGGGEGLQAWAVKDMEGNSSVARHNRRIYNEQLKDKTKDAWERDPANQGKTYDEDKDFDDAYERYRPELQSAEHANLERGNRDDAKQKARDEKREKSTHEDAHVDHMRAGAELAGDSFSYADERKAREDYNEDTFDWSMYTKQESEKPATKGDVETAKDEAAAGGDEGGEGGSSATQDWVTSQIEAHALLTTGQTHLDV